MGKYLRNFMIARDHTTVMKEVIEARKLPPATKRSQMEEQRADHRPEVQTLGTGGAQTRMFQPGFSVYRVSYQDSRVEVWGFHVEFHPLAHHNSMVIKSWLCPWKCAGR